MKNKKLFAILTLVCFMMTLMPVAAFAAVDPYVEVNEESATITAGESATINLYNVTTAGVYVYAVDSNGKLVEDSPVLVSGPKAETTVTLDFEDADTYTILAGENKSYVATTLKDGVDKYIAAEGPAKALSVLGTYPVEVSKDANTVVVKTGVKNNYALSFVSSNVDENGVIEIEANSGYNTEKVTVQLTNNGTPVKGAELTVVTGSSAVDVDKTTLTTDGAGRASFKVTASIAGTYEIDVKYGNKVVKTLTVEAGTLVPAIINNIYTPSNPIALDDTLGAEGIAFEITDANGNVITSDKSLVRKADGVNGNYTVAVTTKPKASDIDADEISLIYSEASGGFVFNTDEVLDAEGTYTFKVTLNNGNYATATIEVKEFQTPVSMTLEYKAPSVELNGYNNMKTVKFVDANGTKRNALPSEYKLAASGYAVDTFGVNANKEAVAGLVKAKADEKYVGSTITVTAVASKYNLVATTSMVVANEAAAVKYVDTKADVAVNNTLTANIVDVDGNKVALNGAVDKADINYVVLEKPENAKVAVSTKATNDLNTKGQFKVSFTASEIGTYKLQTVVTYEQADGVVKYYTGIEEITVGNTGFNDIVVMSINSNEIVVNAKKVAIDAAPIVKNDRTFVPFRALAEAFGAEVAYDEATQAVTAELNGTTVVMTIGSATYTINGVEKTMDVAPFINGSRTMIPVRFAAEAFGINVTPTYDENGATADVLFAK